MSEIDTKKASTEESKDSGASGQAEGPSKDGATAAEGGEGAEKPKKKKKKAEEDAKVEEEPEEEVDDSLKLDSDVVGKCLFQSLLEVSSSLVK